VRVKRETGELTSSPSSFILIVQSVTAEITAHDMDEDDDETDRKSGKGPLFPPSPPRASSRLGGGEEGFVNDFERLWKSGRKLDQVSRLLFSPRTWSDKG
jgi:hypothetical protein